MYLILGDDTVPENGHRFRIESKKHKSGMLRTCALVVPKGIEPLS